MARGVGALGWITVRGSRQVALEDPDSLFYRKDEGLGSRA